ncbi:FAD-binding oxidoreductase [Streptomyces sp. 21So2-11]|uniref:FAD-binding oxidoreductase n=1 Tax=Streptomyces sp. 21So2-11 TaxID=3144408 RepID=UPI003219EE58
MTNSVTSTTHLPAHEVKALNDRTRGPVLVPGDGGFDEERAGFQTAYRHRPAVVVGAESAEDVRAAVRFAAAYGLPVAVQATGHGLSVAADGGVLISTRRMDGVRIDAGARTAWIGAGARWEQVVEAAAPYGLAPLSGSAPGVGAVSYTLGGGIGLLARQFGYAADQLRCAEIVTADGRLRQVDAAGDPELLWALRGAGHNFGVVTGIAVGLVPVGSVYGGGMYFDGGRADDVLRAYADWTATAPDEVTSSVGLIPYPDLPQLPGPLRGRYVAHVRIAFNGTPDDGERLVAPLRAVGPRLIDDLRELPYSEGASIYQDPPFPHAYSGNNTMVRALDPAALRAVLELTGPGAPLMHVVDLRQLGGALSREPAGASAVGNREARYILRVVSMLEGPGATEAAREVHDLVTEALAGAATGSSLPFLYGDGERATEAQTRTGYSEETYRRLAALKTALDPANLFRYNRNILPVTPVAHHKEASSHI